VKIADGVTGTESNCDKLFKLEFNFINLNVVDHKSASIDTVCSPPLLLLKLPCQADKGSRMLELTATPSYLSFGPGNQVGTRVSSLKFPVQARFTAAETFWFPYWKNIDQKHIGGHQRCSATNLFYTPNLKRQWDYWINILIAVPDGFDGLRDHCLRSVLGIQPDGDVPQLRPGRDSVLPYQWT